MPVMRYLMELGERFAVQSFGSLSRLRCSARAFRLFLSLCSEASWSAVRC